MSCILVVDDDPELRGAIALVLEHAGRCVRQAADGAAALELARAHAPAAIVLDLQMPGADGGGFLDARGAIPGLAAVPVVLMSGWSDGAAAVAARHPGVALLPKPFRAADLRRLVERLAPA